MRATTPCPDPDACLPESLACGDFALVQLSDGSFIAGKAPFEHSEEPSEEMPSFYVNDFRLSVETPWRIPSEWCRLSSLGELAFNAGGSDFLEWEDPEFTDFSRSFRSIMGMLDDGKLVKAVPAVSSRCKVNNAKGIARDLIGATCADLHSASLCAFQENGSGFAALTPERLVSIEGRSLKAMALAGTATSDQCEKFIKDKKEQKEHLYVVDSLKSVLNPMGKVRESTREILDLGAIVHFMTQFSVELSGQPVIDDVIKALHPTPAVGVVPRKEELVDRLCSLRDDHGVPVAFGSPFGVKIGECFESFVLIRGIFWSGNDVYLPTGCGLLKESVLEQEWEELIIKREWVKKAFSLV